MAKKDPKDIPDRVTVSLSKDMQTAVRDYWQLIGMDQEDWIELPHAQKLLMMARRGVRGARKALEDSE